MTIMSRGLHAALMAAVGLMLAARASGGEGVWTSFGPASEYISVVAVDPSAGAVFAASRSSPDVSPESVLFKSLDAGAHWLTLVPAPAGTFVAGIASDPERPGLVYGLLSSGNLYRSLDGGASWQLVRAFGASSTGIVLDPRDSRIISILGSICPAPEGCGASSPVAPVATIFRQSPGQDWQMLAIDGARTVSALAIDPTVPNRLYAGTDTGVARSSDGGIRWEAAGHGTESGCASVSAFAVGPGGTLLLSYWEHFYGFTECGAVYRSTDGATTWGPVRNLPYHALSLVFDPAHRGTAWAAAEDFFPSFVYRSLDDGASWELANEGLDGRTPRQLAIDASGEHVYAATTEAGVFALEVPDSSRALLPPSSPGTATRSVGPRP
jgi:photosystem II stability/assembly factor-like uncharacterized protein